MPPLHSFWRVFLCVVLLLAVFGTVTSNAQEGENLLQNGGFEGEYVTVGGDPSLEVAPNWQPWNLPPPEDASSSAINLRPDYQPAPANRVRSGNAAQEYNTFFATHDGGVYQRVPVETGAELQFSAFIYVWSSATFEDPDQSIEPQEVMVMVGIDPTGGQDGGSDTVIWSEGQEFYDEYRELSVSATAEATAVTVFVRSAPQGAVGVNNIYVDDAILIQTGTVTPEATEEPAPEATEEPAPETTEEPAPETTEDAGSSTTDAGSGGNDTITGDATSTSTPSGTTTPSGNNTTAPVDNTAIPATLPNRLTHTVAAGDTIFGLAQRYNSVVEAIVAANGLTNVNFVTVGQQLVIPVPATTPNSTGGNDTTTGTNTTGTNTTGTNTTGNITPPTNTGLHVVQAGENLYRIALRYNTTVEALATLNNITNPNLVTVGSTLRVPTGATTPPAPNLGTGGAINTGTHVVQAGENAFRIGLIYNVTVETLALANGLSNPNLIYVGQSLVIPR